MSDYTFVTLGIAFVCLGIFEANVRAAGAEWRGEPNEDVFSCEGNATFVWIFESAYNYELINVVTYGGQNVMFINSTGHVTSVAPFHAERDCPTFQNGRNQLYCVSMKLIGAPQDIYSCIVTFDSTTNTTLEPTLNSMNVCAECPSDTYASFPSVTVNPGPAAIKLARRDETIQIPSASNAQIEVEVPQTNCSDSEVTIRAYLDDELLPNCIDSTSLTCSFALTVEKTKKVDIEYHFTGWSPMTQNVSFNITEKAPTALWQCLAALIEGIVSIVFNVIVIIICILIIRGKLRHPLVKEIPTNTGGNGNVNETANQKSIIWVKLKPMVLFITIIVVFAILFILGILFFALCPDKEDDLAAIVVAVICIVLFLVAVVLLMVVFMKRTSSCREKTMDSDNIRNASPVTVSNVAVTTSSHRSLYAKPASQRTPRHAGQTLTPPSRLTGITSKPLESGRARTLQPLSKPNAVSPDNKNPENGEVDNKKKKKKKKKKKQREESKDDDIDGDVN